MLVIIIALGWAILVDPIGWNERSGFRTVEQAQAAENKLKAGMVDPSNGKRIKYWVAPMDPGFVSDKPGKSPMGMELVPVYQEQGDEKLPSSTIRIDSATIQNMGVRIAPVTKEVLKKTIRTYGSVTYDEKRIYAVSTKFDGWIERLYVDFEGEKVRKGQPLFEIYSPELVSAQQEYMLALEQYRSLAESAYPDIRQSARRLLEAARIRLRYWDLSEQQIEQIGKQGRVRKTLVVYSQANGVVIKKNAVEGHFVKAGEHQYEIADLSQVWVDVDIYEYELPWIHQGMPATMELAYIPGRKYRGKVLYIYPYLSAKTRTARLRLVFANHDYKLKPGMYANIFLEAGVPGKQLTIAQEAVIDTGMRKIVFVDKGKGRFEPRQVELGVEVDKGRYQVLKGLKEGEKVVVSAQFLLDSESRLQEAIQKMLSARSATRDSMKKNTMEGMDMKADTANSKTGSAGHSPGVKSKGKNHLPK